MDGRLPLFRSPEQERILVELFIRATEPISLSELARRTNTSVGGVHKEVGRLEASGLIISRPRGRSREVEVNTNSPLHHDLRNLLLKTHGPVPLISSSLEGVHDIEEAFIYGSWADPARHDPADIDVMIIGTPDLSAVFQAVEPAEALLGRPVNVSVVSREEWDAQSTGFLKSVGAGPRIDLI